MVAQASQEFNHECGLIPLHEDTTSLQIAFLCTTMTTQSDCIHIYVYVHMTLYVHNYDTVCTYDTDVHVAVCADMISLYRRYVHVIMHGR